MSCFLSVVYKIFVFCLLLTEPAFPYKKTKIVSVCCKLAPGCDNRSFAGFARARGLKINRK